MFFYIFVSFDLSVPFGVASSSQFFLSQELLRENFESEVQVKAANTKPAVRRSFNSSATSDIKLGINIFLDAPSGEICELLGNH